MRGVGYARVYCSLECEQPGHSRQHQQGHFTEDQPSQFVWTNQTDQEKQQQQIPMMRDLSRSDLDMLPQQQPVSWRCRDPHCNEAFASDAERQLHETESHQLNVTEGVTVTSSAILRCFRFSCRRRTEFH